MMMQNGQDGITSRIEADGKEGKITISGVLHLHHMHLMVVVRLMVARDGEGSESTCFS